MHVHCTVYTHHKVLLLLLAHTLVLLQHVNLVEASQHILYDSASKYYTKQQQNIQLAYIHLP